MLSIVEWFEVLGFGILAGAIGQVLRTVVGLKKASDSSGPGTTMSDNFDGSRMMYTLLLGAVAGALAAATTINTHAALANVDQKTFLALVAAGYAGVDFIEGFMSKYMPSNGSSTAVGGSGGAAGGGTAATPAKSADGSVG